jgi:predicted adenine nucleotide alpha hydrolase (AANH) superfamily ATPase
MESVGEYIRRADEAEKIAEKSSDPYIRALYAEIADHWRQIACSAREIESGRDLWKL